MTTTEYDILKAQIATAEDELTLCDQLTADIERMEAMSGNVYQVAFIDAGGQQIKSDDSTLISQAETKLAQLIAAKKAEREAI